MMNRRQLETLLVTLESTPALLERAAGDLPAAQVQRRPAGGGFSLVENVWHLADLEREGYGVRIRRLLSEEEPSLANFDGDRIARERRYQDRDLAEGLAAFAAARRRNLEKLRGVRPADWNRAGVQESVGRICLADLPRKMAEHDRSHTQDIRLLLSEIRGESTSDRGDRQTSAVA
jgi:DinB superfamily